MLQLVMRVSVLLKFKNHQEKKKTLSLKITAKAKIYWGETVPMYPMSVWQGCRKIMMISLMFLKIYNMKFAAN